jgi:fatty acid desaturase
MSAAPPPAAEVRPESIDLVGLEAALNALRDRLRAEAGPEDAAHLRKILWWNRLCLLLGYGTAWIAVNPLSPILISVGLFTRWAVLAHHIMHKGYDRIPGLPPHLTSKRFGRGWRRWIDWPDWMHPETWRHEHNILHHYRLGELADPDQPERNLELLRRSPWPMPVRRASVLLGAMLWKIYYYPSSSETALHAHERRRDPEPPPPMTSPMDRRLWLPWHPVGRRTWLRSWLPYAAFRYGLVPLPFLALGTGAWLAVLINSAIAELLTNLHAFVTIVPNHAGDDLYRFDTPMADRGEFYLRQIVGSTDYRTGGDLNDFLHGWLNYQIEHHLWPDMTMLQYRKAQPEVKAICARFGVPYAQSSVVDRTRKLVDVMVGAATMPHWPATQPNASAGDDPPRRFAASSRSEAPARSASTAP